MTRSKTPPSARLPIKKGGKFIPALCNILGTLILIAVIATSLPLALPRMFGYEIYNVVSGSMAPAIPVGSVIYVKEIPPEDIVPGDIIAFRSEGAVVTHRVEKVLYFEGNYITKGDANEMEDFTRVSYSDLIGIVKLHFPELGRLMAIYSSPIAKLYLLCLACCGVMFNILASRIRASQAEKFRLQLARYEMLRAAKRDAETDGIRK